MNKSIRPKWTDLGDVINEIVDLRADLLKTKMILTCFIDKNSDWNFPTPAEMESINEKVNAEMQKCYPELGLSRIKDTE